MHRSEPAQAIDVLLASRVRSLSFLRARVGDEATAEDILQSACVKALGGASSIRAGESVVAWFHRVLRNAVVDHFRRRGAESRALRALGMETETAVHPGPRAAICACRAVEQVDLEEVPVPELARREGISPSSAAVRLHRARRAVARELSKLCAACATHGCLDCGCRRTAGGDLLEIRPSSV